MIEVVVGDLFESGAQTLVNTVNCVGVMGKGVALQFKKRFPAMFEDYRARCASGGVQLGRPYIWRAPDGRQVLNFPTKDHWRGVSQLSAIVDGLRYLSERVDEWHIESLAVPPLGCGHGQLEWSVVGPTLYRHLAGLEIPVKLFAPHETTPEQLQINFLAAEGARTNAPEESRIPAAWVALVAVVARIRENPHHWPIGRTSFQKLAYFATEEGVPTGLVFERADYGPFAKDISILRARLLANAVIVERQMGQKFVIEEGPTFEDACRRHRAEIASWRDALRRVVDLFMRLPKTRDAELAATVHFQAALLAQHGERPTELDVFKAIQAWKGERIEDDAIAHAIRGLGAMRWVDLKPSDDLPGIDDLAC